MEAAWRIAVVEKEEEEDRLEVGRQFDSDLREGLSNMRLPHQAELLRVSNCIHIGCFRRCSRGYCGCWLADIAGSENGHNARSRSR